MLAGSVVVEVVFAWPGLGRLITSSIFNRDYPKIQGYVLLMAIVFVISNLMADIISTLIDPRIRIGDDKLVLKRIAHRFVRKKVAGLSYLYRGLSYRRGFCPLGCSS